MQALDEIHQVVAVRGAQIEMAVGHLESACHEPFVSLTSCASPRSPSPVTVVALASRLGSAGLGGAGLGAGLGVPALVPPSCAGLRWQLCSPWRLRSAGVRAAVALAASLAACFVARHPVEARRVDDVCDRAEAARLPVGRGLALPSVGAHSELLAQEGEEDPRLLVPEAREASSAGREARLRPSIPDQTFSALPP